MAEKQASYIQASSHPADTDRLVLEGLLNPSPAPVSGAGYGVGPNSGDLLVTQNGTPNMSVNVAAGHVWIDGTESATQGAYHCYNDATKNLVIAASDPTNARKDLVIAKVQDAAYSGAVNAWTLAVVTGTPAASPAEPAIPANAVVLAMINVAALATTITNANITDRRRRACGLSGVGVCLSTSRPAAPYAGQVAYETDTGKLITYNGSSWVEMVPGGAWTDYSTAVITQGATITKTPVYSRYARFGRLIQWNFRFALTSAGTAANRLNIVLPQSSGMGNGTVMGNGVFYDASVPRKYTLVALQESATLLAFDHDSSTTDSFGVSPAVTVANSDIVYGCITYEAAS